ncbi:hypothetical protein DM02DRAFT_518667 [Periconia macrospinosa]|uniref:Uncharacterized protein n=1 Tax=Periconia macrospinosa TaxID=97972 RepID=A0A2V1E2A9_9PLEO|nr:hypothetical protein DM02DRAFT_518667 [Periconia macrospinosa]
MPRPRRAKVASATARVAQPSKPADPTPRKPQPTNASKKRTTAITKPLDTFSDDSDGLVVRATRSQTRMPWHPEPQKDVDFTMTGALLVDTVETDTPSSNYRTPQSRASKRTRNSLERPRESSTKSTPASAASQRRRSTQSNAHQTPAREGDSSGFGDQLLSFTSLGSDSPAHGTRPPSAIKVGATPAHEDSVLALTNFKRRPRQHSLLRMVQQTTDVEDNDLDDFDFDDFLPEAESTPLHVTKAAPGDITGNDSGVNLSSSGSRGKKRKMSPVVQVPRSSPPYEADADAESSGLSSPELPEVIHSTEEAHHTQDTDEPEALSETMAPPMSSSDYENNVIDHPQPTHRATRRKRGTSAKAAMQTDSEGDVTDRPRQSRGRQKQKSSVGISTAKLQSLLPRRRTQVRHEDEFDLPEEDDSDMDELALPPRRHTAASSKSAPPKTKKKTRAAKKPAPKPAQKNLRTYGRRPSSDKENEEAQDEENIATSATTKPSDDPLERLAKKFEEVDKFELDFESVSYEQSSSPPR